MAAKTTRRGNPNSLPSILSTAMVLLMLALFLAVALNAKKISDFLRENMVMTAYLNNDISEQEVKTLKRFIEKFDEVKEVRYTSEKEAAEAFEQELGQDFVNALGYNPIPGSFDIVFNADALTQTTMSAIKKSLIGKEGVREVVYQTGLLDQLNKNTNMTLLVISALGFVFLLIAVTLINSTIRLDLYSKRFIIRSMQMVGATKWFIIRPFLWRSMINGFVAWIVAMILFVLISYILLYVLAEAAEIIKPEEFAIIVTATFVLGMVLTFISSITAIRKNLRLKLENLY
jgi:cell division transport system permease protein